VTDLAIDGVVLQLAKDVTNCFDVSYVRGFSVVLRWILMPPLYRIHRVILANRSLATTATLPGSQCAAAMTNMHPELA